MCKEGILFFFLLSQEISLPQLSFNFFNKTNKKALNKNYFLLDLKNNKKKLWL